MIYSISLQKFRSYKDSAFEFERGVNIIIGANGSGKTNLLEAVLVLAQGKSFRAKDHELIQLNKPWARLDGHFADQTRVVKLVRQDKAFEKSYQINQQPFKRLSLDKTLPVFLFEPNHLQLIPRGPEFRRQYFDDVLERSQAGFKALASSYRRVLAQRNALLKQHPAQAKKQLFAWDVRLSELGSQIASARQQLADKINKDISKIYSQIAGRRSRAEIIYSTPLRVDNYSSQLLKKLESAQDQDFSYGFTSHGPHREDFVLNLNSQLAQASASRGENRSLLVALKIIELHILEKSREQKPIFLLDDVFSELDGSRRRHLVDFLKDYQTIITTTDADAVVNYFSKTNRLISLSSNR
jgi:DNA replication and repair protein RecF